MIIALSPPNLQFINEQITLKVNEAYNLNINFSENQTPYNFWNLSNWQVLDNPTIETQTNTTLSLTIPSSMINNNFNCLIGVQYESGRTYFFEIENWEIYNQNIKLNCVLNVALTYILPLLYSALVNESFNLPCFFKQKHMSKWNYINNNQSGLPPLPNYLSGLSPWLNSNFMNMPWLAAVKIPPSYSFVWQWQTPTGPTAYKVTQIDNQIPLDFIECQQPFIYSDVADWGWCKIINDSTHLTQGVVVLPCTLGLMLPLVQPVSEQAYTGNANAGDIQGYTWSIGAGSTDMFVKHGWFPLLNSSAGTFKAWQLNNFKGWDLNRWATGTPWLNLIYLILEQANKQQTLNTTPEIWYLFSQLEPGILWNSTWQSSYNNVLQTIPKIYSDLAVYGDWVNTYFDGTSFLNGAYPYLSMEILGNQRYPIITSSYNTSVISWPLTQEYPIVTSQWQSFWQENKKVAHTMSKLTHLKESELGVGAIQSVMEQLNPFHMLGNLFKGSNPLLSLAQTGLETASGEMSAKLSYSNSFGADQQARMVREGRLMDNPSGAWFNQDFQIIQNYPALYDMCQIVDRTYLYGYEVNKMGTIKDTIAYFGSNSDFSYVKGSIYNLSTIYADWEAKLINDFFEHGFWISENTNLIRPLNLYQRILNIINGGQVPSYQQLQQEIAEINNMNL